MREGEVSFSESYGDISCKRKSRKKGSLKTACTIPDLCKGEGIFCFHAGASEARVQQI
jgi:hypothetical protein